MQALFENMQGIEYALYLGETDVVDASGFKTGDKAITYSTPVNFRAMLTANRGSADTETFGVNTNYDRTMITADMTCPIDETTILWIGKPSTVGGVVQPHNYKVVQVAKSLNVIQYALKEVKVS